jgi:alginate O-acetyltransferase complex protein AlgI
LLIVFVLTGVWHGASWNFVVWGLFHGFFLASEHMGFSRILSRIWSPIQHLYLISVIILSWVLFRADNITHAMDYYSAMLNMDNWHTSALQYARVSSDESIYVFVIGCVFTMPVYLWSKHYLGNVSKNSKVKIISLVYIPKFTFLLLILLVSILKTASSTYNPFIYFRF